MDWVAKGNIIEGCFWLAVSLFFVASAVRRGEKHRGFCIYGAMVFLAFGISDFYEAHTGAWWKPWWLMLWKGLCCAGIGGVVWGYIRIRGSWQALAIELPLLKYFFRNRSTRG